ncbi:hypothetical protein [Herpetosiphon sp. NSE202]|uniref:hypothetical protein n=1 Tax=Herpetosiphon sp. NSE202 TaxID=3351349 RepID=UPI00362920A5
MWPKYGLAAFDKNGWLRYTACCLKVIERCGLNKLERQRSASFLGLYDGSPWIDADEIAF